jgi:hypothetical protein
VSFSYVACLLLLKLFIVLIDEDGIVRADVESIDYEANASVRLKNPVDSCYELP